MQTYFPKCLASLGYPLSQSAFATEWTTRGAGICIKSIELQELYEKQKYSVCDPSAGSGQYEKYGRKVRMKEGKKITTQKNPLK